MTALIGVSGLRRTLPRDLRAGAIAFCLVFPIVLAVGWIAARIASALAGRAPDPMAHETLKQIADPSSVIGPGALWWWITVAGVTVGAPLAEELVYRGFLQTSLRRMLAGPASSRPDLRLATEHAAPPPRSPSTMRCWIPVLVVASVFTLMHAAVVSPHALVTLFVLALGFGIAYERTGRLVVPIVMHILFNAANVVLAFAMP
jgi:membrane protease YdiL (CAAX protease family)